MRQRLQIFLSDAEAECLRAYAQKRETEEYAKDEQAGLAPSRRCRGFPISRAARELILQGLKYK